jgi:hypothetical protein
MSEWLTTGQMIDRLKVGEVAIPDDEKYLAVKRGMGGFIWVNRHTFEKSEIHKDYFRIDRYTVGLKWRILPKYVSFEEAMKALMNGKTVWLWQGDEKVGYYIDRKSGKLWAIAGDCTAPVEKIYFGEKWTIEE